MSKMQSGIPVTPIKQTGRRANGLLLRGVVVETYVTDDSGHPQADTPADQAPIAVYCDVLVFPSIPGQRWVGLRNVLVTQEIAGLHRGRIWKPRPASIDFLDSLSIEEGSNPAYMDGDHVLVGFMNDNLAQPVIMRALPHPQTDLGREDKALGRRMKLTDADGDPDLFRHHGVHWGVDDLGNYGISTNYANDGVIDADGKEPPPSGASDTGNITLDLPKEAKLTINLNDMSSVDSPSPQLTFTLEDGKCKIEIDQSTFTLEDDKCTVEIASGATVEITEKDSDAKLVLGDGAKSAAIAERLEALYTSLVAEINKFNTHTHGGVMSGPAFTGTPTASTPPTTQTPPTWDSLIASTKLKLPDS